VIYLMRVQKGKLQVFGKKACKIYKNHRGSRI
jgi:hypothetical protein